MSTPIIFLRRLNTSISHIPLAKKIYDIIRLALIPRYREHNLATVNNCDFLTDPVFVRSHAAAERQEKIPPMRWRAHVAQWAACHSLHLAGDFVECGVNRGYLSASIIEYTNFKSQAPRQFYLFDTYEGFVKELLTPDDTVVKKYVYPDCYQFVCESFKHLPNVVIVKGPVPDTLKTVPIDKVAYLCIDMNCIQPEIAALEHFWPKLVEGGVVLLDDYGYPGHEAQKRAHDKFAASAGVSILCLPTAQGLLIKPPAHSTQ